MIGNPNIIKAGLKIIKAAILRRSKPIIVALSLTKNCDKDCLYCDSSVEKNMGELKTGEIFELLDELKEVGVEILTLSGGEPLFRKDVGKIVSRSKINGFFVTMNSNGSRVPQNRDVIENIDILTLSIGGNREIHDKIRGDGSYKEVIDAVKIAKECNTEVQFASTINKFNWDKIDYLLSLAKKLNCPISFQPATSTNLFSGERNPIAPSQKENEKAIEHILHKKLRGYKWILNSLENLKHLSNFPEHNEIECDMISCRISSKGYVMRCGRDESGDFKNIKNIGFDKAFSNLTGGKCFNCWCAERSALCQTYSLNIKSIIGNFFYLI